MLEVVVKEDLRNHKSERKIGGKHSTHAGTCDASWLSERSLRDFLS